MSVLYKPPYTDPYVRWCGSRIWETGSGYPINKDKQYLEARNRLQSILEDAICEREIPNEMKQILSPYLNCENSDSDIADLSDVGVDGLDIEENLPPTENLLTEENLEKFNRELASQPKQTTVQDLLPFSEILDTQEHIQPSGDLDHCAYDETT